MNLEGDEMKIKTIQEHLSEIHKKYHIYSTDMAEDMALDWWTIEALENEIEHLKRLLLDTDKD